jgi:hypothetical protein
MNVEADGFTPSAFFFQTMLLAKCMATSCEDKFISVFTIKLSKIIIFFWAHPEEKGVWSVPAAMTPRNDKGVSDGRVVNIPNM